MKKSLRYIYLMLLTLVSVSAGAQTSYEDNFDYLGNTIKSGMTYGFDEPVSQFFIDWISMSIFLPDTKNMLSSPRGRITLYNNNNTKGLILKSIDVEKYEGQTGDFEVRGTTGSKPDLVNGTLITETNGEDLSSLGYKFVTIDVTSANFQFDHIKITWQIPTTPVNYTVDCKYQNSSEEYISITGYPKVKTNNVGEYVTEYAPTITGYDLTSTDVRTIQLSDDAAANKIVFLYKEKKTTNYTIQCVDADLADDNPNRIIKTITEASQTGEVGKTVNVGAPSITNYTPVNYSVTSGTLSEDANLNVVTISYHKTSSSYTIEYFQSGEEDLTPENYIHTEYIGTGTIGNTVNVSLPSIAGYITPTVTPSFVVSREDNEGTNLVQVFYEKELTYAYVNLSYDPATFPYGGIDTPVTPNLGGPYVMVGENVKKTGNTFTYTWTSSDGNVPGVLDSETGEFTLSPNTGNTERTITITVSVSRDGKEVDQYIVGSKRTFVITQKSRPIADFSLVTLNYPSPTVSATGGTAVASMNLTVTVDGVVDTPTKSFSLKYNGDTYTEVQQEGEDEYVVIPGIAKFNTSNGSLTFTSANTSTSSQREVVVCLTLIATNGDTYERESNTVIQSVAEGANVYKYTIVCRDNKTGNEIKRYSPVVFDINDVVNSQYTVYAKVGDNEESVNYDSDLANYILVSGETSKIDVVVDVYNYIVSFYYVPREYESVSFAPNSEYASYCPLQNVTIPDGIKAYWCSNVDPEKGTITLQLVSNKRLAAHEGVLLRRSTEDIVSQRDVKFEVYAGDAESFDLNKMEGVWEPEGRDFEARSIYVYGKISNEPLKFGYGIFTGTHRRQGTSHIWINQAHAVEKAPVLRMLFEDDNITEIDEAIVDKTANKDDALYTISGTKVNSMDAKGIYIKNGKKILKKN